MFQLKVKNTGTSHLIIGKGQVKLTSETAIKAKAEEAKNTSIIEKQMSDLNVNNQIEAQTGAILKYFGDGKDGIIKTPKHGEIAFSIETGMFRYFNFRKKSSFVLELCYHLTICFIIPQNM